MIIPLDKRIEKMFSEMPTKEQMIANAQIDVGGISKAIHDHLEWEKKHKETQREWRELIRRHYADAEERKP